jgi:hypothetical protein
MNCAWSLSVRRKLTSRSPRWWLGIAEKRDHGVPLRTALDQATQSGSSDPYWPRAVSFVYAHPELNREAVEASWDEHCLSGTD